MISLFDVPPPSGPPEPPPLTAPPPTPLWLTILETLLPLVMFFLIGYLLARLSGMIATVDRIERKIREIREEIERIEKLVKKKEVEKS